MREREGADETVSTSVVYFVEPVGLVIVQLIYASAATAPFTPDALRMLLARSRSRNTMLGITGMLVYHSGSFLQVLEGPETSIEIIYRSIVKDPRHHSTRKLLREEILRREFEGWAMGFADTTNTATPLAGHVSHRELALLSDADTRAKEFLRNFRQGLYRQQIGAGF